MQKLLIPFWRYNNILKHPLEMTAELRIWDAAFGMICNSAVLM